jgi:hypothetical protein
VRLSAEFEFWEADRQEQIPISQRQDRFDQNAPHAYAERLFINWLLSNDGQTAFTRALSRPTRRLHLDAHWTKEFGHLSTKEVLIPQNNDDRENGSEETVLRVRKPAMKLAEKLFQ